MSGRRRRTHVPLAMELSPTTRRVLRDAVAARRATTANDSSSIDKELARRIEVKQKKGRRRRCMTCGHQFPPDELHHEFDEEGRRVGWVCDGCF